MCKNRGRSHNRRDGMQRLCRLVASPDEPRLEGRTDAIFARDVVELLDEPRGMDVTHGGRGARPRRSLRTVRS